MRQQGISLVEMMIALALGMIVVGAAMAIYVSAFSANSTQMRMSRLNNDLRSVMTQITRDLRRAGYHNWSLATHASRNYLTNPQATPTITASASTTQYDEDSNSAAANSEIYAFQWADTDGDTINDTIQARIGSGGWTNLTDPDVIRITNFVITNNSPAAINPTGAVAAITIPVYAIEITGQLVADATIQRSIRETVRARNPIVVANP